MSLDPLIQFISRNPFFAELPQETLRLLAFSAEQKVLPARSILYNGGDAADSAYLILEGVIRLTPLDTVPDIEVRDVGEGTLLDGIALIIETKRSAKAKAETDTTLLRVSRSLFLRLIQEFPEARHALARRLTVDVQRNLNNLQQVLNQF